MNKNLINGPNSEELLSDDSGIHCMSATVPSMEKLPYII